MKSSFIVGSFIGSVGFGLYRNSSPEAVAVGFAGSLLIGYILTKVGVLK